MRQFRHLTKAEIRDIIEAWRNGAKPTDLATQYKVDPSTISYHLNKFERSYPEEGSFYASLKIRIRKVCVHPSGRCNFCGEMWDGIKRVERELIATLTRQNEEYRRTLRIHGLLME